VTRSHPDTTAGDAPGGVDGAPDDVTRADGLPSLDADTDLDAALEALLLVVDDPTEDEVLASALGEPVARIRVALQRLSAAYTTTGRGIDLRPVTRARVAAVRGVNCDGVLRTLLTRGLVEEAGVDPQTQGTLFRTTELFLERLGLDAVTDLPPLAPLLPDVDSIDALVDGMDDP